MSDEAEAASGQPRRTRTIRRRRKAAPDINSLPLVLTIDEVAEVLRIGRSAAYELVRRTDASGLRSVRVGRKIRIPRHSLVEFLFGSEGNNNTTS